MFGLPKTTELKKQLPKNAIYAKFNMNNAQKEKFDADISRINIVAEISPATINIEKGENVSAIYVVQVVLKRKDFDERTIIQLSKLIDQNMILALEFEGKIKLAIYHTKLIQSEWQDAVACKIELTGLNLDKIWEGIIAQIGDIKVQEGATLDEQIAADEYKASLILKIERLQARIRKEKQLNVQMKLNTELKKLKKELEVL